MLSVAIIYASYGVYMTYWVGWLEVVGRNIQVDLFFEHLVFADFGGFGD